MRETTISVSWNYYFTKFYKMLLDKQFKKNCVVLEIHTFFGGKYSIPNVQVRTMTTVS